jgi:aspartate kinase
MKKKLKVFKFGGASVKDPAGIKNVAGIIQKHKGEDSLLVIVSAIGKTTDALEHIIAAHANKTGHAQQLLDKLKAAHYQIMDELFDKNDPVYDEVNDTFVAVEWVLEDEPHPNYDFMYDQVICVGELVSSRILAAYLNRIGQKTHWFDARDVIRTDDIYREGWVQWEETVANAREKVQPLAEKGDCVVTQGFIGSTNENFTTTLGREGSDYSAAIFSFCLDARDMTIWKDVPGVLTGDPRLFDHVTKLDRLSYLEAIEMTYYGAKAIHLKTIKPLQDKNIPLYVKSFIHSEGEGTYIGPGVEDLYPPIVAIEKKQALLDISTRDFSFVAEHHLAYLFDKMAECRLQVNLIQNSGISFTVCVNHTDDKIFQFAKCIGQDYRVVIDHDNVELINVRHYTPHTIEMLREGRIILVEDRSRHTLQMVAKTVPQMSWKS